MLDKIFVIKFKENFIVNKILRKAIGHPKRYYETYLSHSFWVMAIYNFYGVKKKSVKSYLFHNLSSYNIINMKISEKYSKLYLNIWKHVHIDDYLRTQPGLPRTIKRHPQITGVKFLYKYAKKSHLNFILQVALYPKWYLKKGVKPTFSKLMNHRDTLFANILEIVFFRTTYFLIV